MVLPRAEFCHCTIYVPSTSKSLVASLPMSWYIVLEWFSSLSMGCFEHTNNLFSESSIRRNAILDRLFVCSKQPMDKELNHSSTMYQDMGREATRDLEVEGT
eukprot:TRINITY_DN16430_c2_g2_i3.p2 TRINITY_DN16430_c2_g2~~TRINITY_DN16430_c2_g2_i3.p2  ORF type:complete len:102 (-),score=14.84 TRINITY_DN16430_c2_g2_i3:513-818(-)